MAAALFLACTACSAKIPDSFHRINLESQYIKVNATLTISSKLNLENEYEQHFLGVTHRNYEFQGQNSTASIQVMLNKAVELKTPAIGEWNTVSTGDCIHKGVNSTCYTSHTDCHLVRTTLLQTGPRSVVVIRVKNKAREPERLCRGWNPMQLTKDQQEEVFNFNTSSDSVIDFKIR